jgi:transposase-like protein
MTITKKTTAASAAFESLLSADRDLLKDSFTEVLEQIQESEMTETLGASRSEPTAGRSSYRSGLYQRSFVTRIGKQELRVPCDRNGEFSPKLFARYQRSEKALVGALSEMNVKGGIDSQGRDDQRRAVPTQLVGFDDQRYQQGAGPSWRALPSADR